MTDYTYCYPSTIPQERALYDDIEKICHEHRFDGQLTNRIQVVLSELFNNAVIHGNKCDPKKEVKVRISVNNTGFFADIIDDGINGLNSIDNRRPSDENAEGGRGVNIVEHYTDSIAYEELPEGGLKVSVSFTFGEKITNK